MAQNNGSTPPGSGGDRGPSRGGGGPSGPNMKLSRNIASWLILMGLALALLVLLQQNVTATDKISITQFWKYVENGQVKELVIAEDGTLRGTRSRVEGDPAGAPKRLFEVKYPPQAIDNDFLKELEQRLPGADIKHERSSPYLTVLLSFLPWLLIFGFIWFFIFRQIRNVSGGGGVLGNFGRSRHRVTSKEHTNVTFADVAGIEEAKDEVLEIVEFLKSPKKFQRLGGRIPRGVLLVGEPGCGKTLLAKAIAGEADVPFFSISGSDFVEMFVGVGASRVRDLFKQAKESSPCIIFLDEIDAVGRRRGASFGGGGHDEREQTLNAILVEMDGFDTNDQVIVIAATNRSDVLDPALVRPGRFDRQVYVPLPDVEGRYKILKVHAKKVKLGPNIDLRRIARGTSGFSGAELAALINEAAMIATMANKDFIEHDDLEEARDKVRWGRSKRSRQIDEEEKKSTAYHEAGHALVQALEKHSDLVHKVSIIPRGPYGGVTFSLPEKDRSNYSERFLLATLRILCAGRIAEQKFTGDVNTGALGDIRQASELARKMVMEWGMNERVGFVNFGDAQKNNWLDLPGGKDYSEVTAQTIDEEVRKLVDHAYSEATRIIDENASKVESIAQALLRYETITGDEVNALIRGESLDRSSVSDLLDDDAASADSVGMARPVKAAPPKPGADLGGGALPQPS